jgi:hypothetical protein
VTQRSRYAFLDLFRAFFVILMVEGHVVRALLSPEAQASEGFRLHELLHGITGPGFLFGAGFAFSIAAYRRREQMRSLSPAFLRRLWRAVNLILIGYALHLPFFSLQKTITAATVEQWNELLAFGPLQCIGFSLLFLRMLFLLTRTDRRFLATLAVVTPAIAYATPFLWSPEISAAVPRPIAMALNGLGGSFYPLFPFSAFVLAGAGISWVFLKSIDRLRTTQLAARLATAGLVLVITGVGLDAVPFATYPVYDFWHTSPNYVLIRLGILLLLLALFWLLFGTREAPTGTPVPGWLVTFGIESFFVYIVHLVLLFGWLPNPTFNLEQYLGSSLGPVSAGCLALGLVALLLPLASVWRFLKKEHPLIVAGLHWWFWGIFLSIFLRSPY